ncbi:MAG: glycosyltransferase [Kiritimatiellia bacterium]
MTIVHFCAGLERNNGMANTARQFVGEELSAGHDSLLTNQLVDIRAAHKIDVLHIHGTWLPVLWKASKIAKRMGAKVIVRPAGNYDPIRRKRGLVGRLKKFLVGPWERAMLERADVLQATCAEETEWIKEYYPGGEGKISLTDLKRFFQLDAPLIRPREDCDRKKLRVLYLGRTDPLKGVRFLERAVADVNRFATSLSPNCPAGGVVDLRIVSNAQGKELVDHWEWADILCLPTLSENFGRVIAEALERGRRVITTDGAPAWRVYFESNPDAGYYLKGFREGNDATRVKLLSDAIRRFID